MKKKIFGSLAVFAIAAIATFNVNVNTQDNGLSDVSLDNVEALAQEAVEATITCNQNPGKGAMCWRFSGVTSSGCYWTGSQSDSC